LVLVKIQGLLKGKLGNNKYIEAHVLYRIQPHKQTNWF